MAPPAFVNKHVDTKDKLKMSRKLIGYLLVILVISVVMNGVSMFGIVEGSKESHVRGGVLESVDGNVVSTKEVESFSTLFDLPYFDMPTLKKIRSLSVVVDGGRKEINFIVSKIVRTPGAASVVFTSANGDAITIDGKSGLAVVQMEGDKCPQTIEAGTVEKASGTL